MYAKIYESMYDGSLRKDWKALVVFQQLLVLCDEEGYVDKTAEAISARTTIPLEFIEHGLLELGKPDPESRSNQEEGRRIILINPVRKWGWRIVNYTTYREIKTQDQLRGYWRGKKQEVRAIAKVSDRTTELKNKISELFNRSEADAWSYLELSMLAEVARRENSMMEFDEIIKLKAREPRYFTKSLAKLLEGWNSYLDRSRAPEMPAENKVPSHIQLRVVESQIECHKANPQSTSYDPKHPLPLREELKSLRSRQQGLQRQIAGMPA